MACSPPIAAASTGAATDGRAAFLTLARPGARKAAGGQDVLLLRSDVAGIAGHHVGMAEGSRRCRAAIDWPSDDADARRAELVLDGDALPGVAE